MSKKVKRIMSVMLSIVMIFSFSFANVAQAASLESSSEETAILRTQLTFIEGVPGENHLVYTYQENGRQYLVSENVDDDFTNVSSVIYLRDSNGDYVEASSQTINVQSDGVCRLTITDSDGNSEYYQIESSRTLEYNSTSTEADNSESTMDYTDPGTGEWVTSTWDGSSYIYNMTISVIGAVLGAAIGGKVGAAIGTIASEYFKKGADYAYYHVIDNWMMSKLHPTTLIIREAVHTTYYLDSGHKYSTGIDYYEYDGRW